MISPRTVPLIASRTDAPPKECIRFDGLLAQAPDYAFERSRIRAAIQAADGELYTAKRPVWLVSCWAFKHTTMYIAHRVPSGWTISSRSLDDLLAQIEAHLSKSQLSSRVG